MAKQKEVRGMSEIKVLLLKPRLRIDEAARLLDVTPRTVSNYLTNGKLTAIVLPGGTRRVANDETFRRYL